MYVSIVSVNESVYKHNTTIELKPNSTGLLASLNYPLPYPKDVHMETILWTPLGNQIVLSLEELDIANTTECKGDTYMQFVDPIKSTNSKRLCGSSMADMSLTNQVTSTMHMITIRFMAGASDETNGSGFVVNYKVIPGESLLLCLYMK